MSMGDIQLELSKGQLRPLYVFTGTDMGILDIYVGQISKLSGELEHVDDLASIYSMLGSKGLLGTPMSYYIRGDEDFLKNGDVERLIKKMERTGTTIVMVFEKIDKRSSFWKKHKSMVVDFEPIKDIKVLEGYVKDKIGFINQDVQQLIRACGNNYGRILIELNKYMVALDIYRDVYDYRMPNTDVFGQLMHVGLLSGDPEDDTIKLVDAVIESRYTDAMALYDDFKRSGGNLMGFLSLVYDGYKALMSVQILGLTDFEKRTGILGWKGKKMSRLVGRYSDQTLVNGMKRIHFVDKSIKTGTLDQDHAFDYLITSLARGV